MALICVDAHETCVHAPTDGQLRILTSEATYDKE